MTVRTRIMLILGLALIPGGCKVVPEAVQPVALEAPPEPGSWRATATEQDRLRIRNWYGAWEAAVADVRTKGFGAQLDGEGPLLSPLAGLPNPHLPPGDYRCRTIKLGSQAGTVGYTAYGWFSCRVSAEQGIVSLVKTSGSQRPIGLIFPDDMRRQIFLGTLLLGDEAIPLDYGSDRMRDMAGLIERIGEARWRLVLPRPAYESLLDVIELVPAN